MHYYLYKYIALEGSVYPIIPLGSATGQRRPGRSRVVIGVTLLFKIAV